jgi:predicted unusual protein kinase regulating ubiquinone biosynthesis (AarF/ABC1/UbiB family)
VAREKKQKDEKQSIPTSRVRRTATVGRLAATEAVKQFGTRAANVTRGDKQAEEAMARRQLETAKQIVAALGTMKGAAMKLGQVMSFLDVGLVGEEHREEFQRELAKLRDAAPTVSFKQMRRVIEDDLEEPIKELFAEFDEEPIAAASIGQVYRARLRGEGGEDGREVAVKVQYPGVAAAVRADLQNLDMIMRLLKRMTPGLDVKAVTQEIQERIAEELDYELEAQNQRSLARIFRGHPFIVVPDVITSLSRERVLVSEFVSGTGFEELKGYPQEQRDRLGEIVFRFFLGCLYRHRQFSGDPHPGNFLQLDDGRVAFLDFGLFKRMEAEPVDLELACQRAVSEGDAATLHRLLGETPYGGTRPPTK